MALVQVCEGCTGNSRVVFGCRLHLYKPFTFEWVFVSEHAFVTPVKPPSGDEIHQQKKKLYRTVSVVLVWSCVHHSPCCVPPLPLGCSEEHGFSLFYATQMHTCSRLRLFILLGLTSPNVHPPPPPHLPPPLPPPHREGKNN